MAAVFIMDWTCPQQGHEGGFVDHSLMTFVARSKDKGSTRQEEIASGVIFAGVSFAVDAVNFAQYRAALARLTG